MASASPTRIFTEIEQRKSDRRRLRAASYAKRFAAKEACSKALGTGIRGGVFWRDMGVVNLPSGKPTMQLTGGAAARLASLIPAGHQAGDPPDHHGRFSARPGLGHHRGSAGRGAITAANRRWRCAVPGEPVLPAGRGRTNGWDNERGIGKAGQRRLRRDRQDHHPGAGFWRWSCAPCCFSRSTSRRDRWRTRC